MQFDEIENKLMCLLNSLKESFPQRIVDNIYELLTAGEYGVALENICSNLLEYDVSVNKSILNEIALIGNILEISSTNWKEVETWKKTNVLIKI
jgi:hypothetical protein